ncbi:MAG TPA: alpha-hydroxy acid oxidase [Oculatellaceae cyanobacterium]
METVSESSQLSPLNLDEYERLAQARLDPTTYDYYSGFACDGVSLHQNRRAYEELTLLPHVLVDVSARDMSVQLFGSTLSMPVMIAPMAFQGLAHPAGEIAMAVAAAKAGTVMVVSTLANFSIQQIRQSSKADLWFQLYVYKDRELTKALVRRAETLGCKALVLTVDAPMMGRRERDIRNRFKLPVGLCLGNLADVLESNDNSPDTATLAKLPRPDDDSGLAAYIAEQCDPSVSWKDIEWFRSITTLPIVLKGILRSDDACKAVSYGVDGIVVSNHGGRQLDTASPTISVLPSIARAVERKCKILIDGGIRRGTDVLKAIALGADAVLVGRPFLWGLAVCGEDGVSDVFELLRSELDLAMALSGCPTLPSITPDLVRS